MTERLKPEERSNDILDCAMRLSEMFDGDYNKITVNHISKELQISRGLVYNYFKDLDSLYVAMIERAKEEQQISILAQAIIKGHVCVSDYTNSQKRKILLRKVNA